MGQDLAADPGAGFGVGERRAVVEAQLLQTRQALQEQRELNLHLAHGLFGRQFLQALPGQALTVQPERGTRGAVLQVHQQVRVQALGETFAVVGQLIGRYPTQGGDLLAVVLRQAVDAQPQERA